MDGFDADAKPRAGSFLPKVIPMGNKPWRRSKKIEKNIIEQQLRENVNLADKLVEIETEMRRWMERMHWQNLAEQYEWFTMQLLEGLKTRGIVKWHIWQKACFNNWFVDSQLGVDHFGELSQAYGGIFFMINTKATEEALRKNRKKERGGYILGFRIRYSLTSATEEQIRTEEDRLLAEIIEFFDSAKVLHTTG